MTRLALTMISTSEHHTCRTRRLAEVCSGKPGETPSHDVLDEPAHRTSTSMSRQLSLAKPPLTRISTGSTNEDQPTIRVVVLRDLGLDKRNERWIST